MKETKADNRSFMDKFHPRDQHKVFDVLSFKLPRIDSNLSCSTSALSQCEWSAIFVNSALLCQRKRSNNFAQGIPGYFPIWRQLPGGGGREGSVFVKTSGRKLYKSVNVGSKWGNLWFYVQLKAWSLLSQFYILAFQGGSIAKLAKKGKLTGDRCKWILPRSHGPRLN